MRAKIAMTMLALGAAACGGTSEAPWLTAPTFDSHARYFPLNGTVHAGFMCKECHHDTDTSFKQFDCVTCHDTRPTTPDAIHVAVGGYVSPPYSAECLQCHPTGSVMMADHGRFFPIGAGTKHDLACSQCHTDPAARSDIAKQQCNVCHVATDPNLATAHSRSVVSKDYTTSAACGGAPATSCPQACLGCHADGHVTTISGHPSFGIPHESSHCLQCHDYGLRTDLVASPLPNTTTPQPYAVDFATNPRSCWSTGATANGCCHCHKSPP